MRTRKAWLVAVRGLDGPSTVFAPSAGRARMDTWRSVCDARGGIRVVDITVRRAEYADVSLPDKAPVIDTLNADELHILLHSYGVTRDPATAGHRDYFYTRVDDHHLVGLVAKGLMKPLPTQNDIYGEGMTYFELTPDGRDAARSVVPLYRGDPMPAPAFLPGSQAVAPDTTADAPLISIS